MEAQRSPKSDFGCHGDDLFRLVDVPVRFCKRLSARSTGLEQRWHPFTFVKT